MRKLVYAINLTLDGCCDHTKGVADEEVHDFHADIVRRSGVLLYGRKTWELMVPFWPDLARTQAGTTRSMNEFAQAFVGVPRTVVFSRTVQQTDSPRTEIARDDLRQRILEMKGEEGGDILVGGVDLASQLLTLDLIDEAFFVFQPVIVGAGRRLFDQTPLPQMVRLQLAESKTFRNGGVALHYLKR